MQAYVQYENPTADLSGPALVREATKPVPRYLTPFADYYLTARREDALSAVLVCDEAQERALLEDAGCTSGTLDAAPWRELEPPHCTFVLDLAKTCPLQ